MLRTLIVLIISSFISISSLAYTPKTLHANKITRVIYITLDGTRWQDIFKERTYFPKLWTKYVDDGTFYGRPGSKRKMEAASIPVSLPSYQAQMAGSVQNCDGNECGRIPVETLIENIIKKLGLNKKEAVTISSWFGISFAIEHLYHATFSNTGNLPMLDPESQQADSMMEELNRQQAANHPDNGADRYDQYTLLQALHYLEKYQPRFLWISFNDADEAAHQGNLDRYHQVLSFYDNAIDTIVTTLKKLHLDEETLVIITTDHGRGNGANWIDHGPEFPESKIIWAFVMNGHLQPISKAGQIDYYNNLSIRPTIETALGAA